MAESLASRIRTKYPGAYDDMSDEELSNKILAKHPQYSDLATLKERAAASLEQQSSGAAKAAIARGEQPAEDTAAQTFLKQAGGRLGDVAKGLGGLATRVGIGTVREGITPTLGKVGVDIAKGIAGSHLREVQKATSAESMSDSERAGHALAAVLPLVGPQAASIGEDIASGNYGGAAVEGAMLAGGAAAPKLVGAVARLSPEIQAALARGVQAGRGAPVATRAVPAAASFLERAGTTPLELGIDLATAPMKTVGKLAKVLIKSFGERSASSVPGPSIPAGASSSGGYSFAGVPNLSSVATPKVSPAVIQAAAEAVPQAGGGELAAVLAREPQLAAQAVERPLNPAWSTPEASAAGGVEVKPGVWKVPPEAESPIPGGTKVSTARLTPEQLAEYRGGIEPVQIFEKGAPAEAREMMTLAAKSGAEPGSRAWFVLEEGGPKYVSSNKAAAAKRAGKQTTWVEVPRTPVVSPAAGFKAPTETGPFLEGSVQLRRMLEQGAKPGPQLVKPGFGTRESSEALAQRLGGEALETPRPYTEFPAETTYGLPRFLPAAPFKSPLLDPAFLERSVFLAKMLGQ